MVGVLALAFSSASQANAQSQPRDLTIQIEQAYLDLHHGLAIEIQVMRVNPGAEQIWKRSFHTVESYLPQCATLYQRSHNLIPSLEQAFRSRDMQTANAIGEQASQLLTRADECARSTDVFASISGQNGTGDGYPNLDPPPPLFGQPPPSSTGGPQPGAPTTGANPCQPFGPGGYDYCANPVGSPLPPGCICQNQPPSGGGPPAPPRQACENVPDPTTQQALRRTGNELLDTFAAMGSQADNMLTHFGRATLAQINLLLHPNQLAAGVQKTAETAVAFLANEDPAKWAMLRDQAVEAFRRDPSGMIGDVGANAFTGELIGGACSVGTAGAKALAAKVAMTQRATGSLKKIVDNMKRAEDGKGEISCAPPIAKAGNPDLTNPFWDSGNCVPSTIAGALRELDGKPWTAVDIVTRYPRGAEVMEQLNAGAGLKGALTFDMMRYFFGTVVPKGLSVDRWLGQVFGVPSEMSRRAIEIELEQAGPGSGGMVFVHFIEDGVEKQHVFKATNQGDVVKYVDNQYGWEGSYNFNDAIWIGFFRYR